MQIIIRSDRTIEAFAGKMKPERLRMALSVAVNATVRQGKNKAAQEISRASSIRRAKVEAGIRLRYATPGSLEGAIRGIGRPLSLKEFGARQGASGVRAVVWGKAQHYAGAFVHAGYPGSGMFVAGGHVFTNTGQYSKRSKRRNKVEKMFGAGVAQVMSQADVESMIRGYAAERLDANVARQLRRYAWAG